MIHILISQKIFVKNMRQCKLCGTPFDNESDSKSLEMHWKKQHSWHWENNKEKTPEEAILKKRN